MPATRIGESHHWWGYNLSNPSAVINVPADTTLLIGWYQGRGNTTAVHQRMDFAGVAMTDILTQAWPVHAVCYVENPATGNQTIDAHMSALDNQGWIGGVFVKDHTPGDPIGATRSGDGVLTLENSAHLVLSLGFHRDQTVRIAPSGDLTEWSWWQDWPSGSLAYKDAPAGATVDTTYSNNLYSWGIEINHGGVPLDDLTLAASAPALTVLAGPTSVLMDELTLAGSMPNMSILPGAVQSVMDTLTLAAALQVIDPFAMPEIYGRNFIRPRSRGFINIPISKTTKQ